MKIFIQTLLYNRFPCDVGDWEHSIKYVTVEGKEQERVKMERREGERRSL